MSKDIHVQWLSKPEERDYPAADSYLSLLYGRSRVTRLIRQLRRAPISRFKAKDIFRASGLSLLGISNSHVEKDRKKILKGEKLSPLLLVRDEKHGKVVIADGYHRMCSVYSFDEDALIPCKIV
jgi:disulfide oxidoreductase YuzD